MNREYITKDLAEASALMVKRLKLIRIDRIGSICWFVFDDSEACTKISSDFFFGELIVNARSYYEAIQILKNRIFSK
jgi:hypothetical protein